MTQEQQIRAWSLVIAALMIGPSETGDLSADLEGYKGLASSMEHYISSMAVDPQSQR